STSGELSCSDTEPWLVAMLAREGMARRATSQLATSAAGVRRRPRGCPRRPSRTETTTAITVAASWTIPNLAKGFGTGETLGRSKPLRQRFRGFGRHLSQVVVQVLEEGLRLGRGQVGECRTYRGGVGGDVAVAVVRIHGCRSSHSGPG